MAISPLLHHGFTGRVFVLIVFPHVVQRTIHTGHRILRGVRSEFLRKDVDDFFTISIADPVGVRNRMIVNESCVVHAQMTHKRLPIDLDFYLVRTMM
jgi:hypothetical protein